MFKQADETVVWQQIRKQRDGLVTYLSTLTADEWDRPSLCVGWACRDVVAHLILEYHYTAQRDWKEFLLSGFSLNRFMKRTARQLGHQTSKQLLRQFQSMANEQQKPNAISVVNVLADTLIHEQDIRLALGQPKSMPIEAARLVFSHWEPEAFNLGERITGIAKRVKGLQFVAMDLAITKGSGEVVQGNAEDILMAVAGRKITIDKLSGPGANILRTRLGSTILQ